MSLKTATEFINFTLMINKVTGFYGILALLTGYHLNPLQLSHYIYSVGVLVLIVWLAPSVGNTQAPLKNLAAAWVYVLDTAINGGYTALFSAGWFFLMAEHMNDPIQTGSAENLTGKGTMADTAGFTDPEFNATSVQIVAEPAPGVLSGQKAIAYGMNRGAFSNALSESDSLTSISLIGLLILVRVYFCIVVMAHARSVLRQYIATTAADTASGYSDASDPTLAESPFRSGREKGMGWQGTLGRLMVRFPTSQYWLGRDDRERGDWERAANGRVDAGTRPLNIKVPGHGVGERERRARSGTGPPIPLAPAKNPSQ